MNSYIESLFKPTEEQLNFLAFVQGDSFPWFYQKSTDNGFYFFSHVFMKRHITGHAFTGMQNSDYLPYVIDIFDSFCKQNNIEYREILRAAANNTQYFGDTYSEIHVDHDFKHKNFLLYVNENISGNTVLFKDNNQIEHEIVPSPLKGAIFGGQPHAHRSCKVNQCRIVLVVTFI